MDKLDFNNVNYSLFAIPAYLAMVHVPHLYAGSMLKATQDVVKRNPDLQGKAGKILYNMPNPRSSDNAGKYSKILDQRSYHRFERARAAHNNLLENAPFVISAILAGVITKLPARDMNIAAGAYLLTRVLYIFSYIRVEKGPMALERTVWFFAGIGFLISLWVKAGKKVMAGDY